MYGSHRLSLVERMARVTEQGARTVATAGRLFAVLVTRQARWRPSDLYAAAATARFMAAHELIGRAEAQVGDDPEVDLAQVRQPLWFGSTTIHEEH